jgi:glycosyltransferase involved in cell wall biosynthesis
LKICFITGPKESKQCGISDYVELITRKLEKLGHEIERYFINKECGTLSDLPNADLYSIQFAPYAFAHSGLPNQTLKCLAQKLQDKKVHLNLHEIWVGAYPRASWKERGIGWLQKSLLLGFIKKCKPAWITSSNAAALDRLKLAGIPARYLYLFGNIPFSAESKLTTKGQALKVAFFGTPYSDFPYDKLGNFFSTLSKTSGKKLEIILIGRQREDTGTDRLLSLCKKNKHLIEKTGELLINLISEQLQDCAVGVSTTPFDVIGKSGATAAMLEHGLPILAYDDGDTPEENLFIPDPFKDQIFLINDHSSVEKILQYIEKPRKSFFDGVAHTANKMLKQSLES